MTSKLAVFFVLAGGAAIGCSSEDPVVEPAGVEVSMDFTRAGGFYAAPFPGEHRRRDDGGVDMSDFPNPNEVPLVQQLVTLLERDADGFGLTSGVLFQLGAPIDEAALPSLASSVEAGAKVFLVSADADAPDRGVRYPVAASFVTDGGPYGAPNLLAMIPLQGIALRPTTTYAAVVLRTLGDATGAPLAVPATLAGLLGGERPDGMSEAAFGVYAAALEELGSQGVTASEIAGLTVFRTGDPELGLTRVVEHMLATGVPAPTAPLVLNEVFDDYCVYESTISMPTYQSGTPPFAQEGGGFVFDATGTPILQGQELANLVVTVPRRAMPTGGFPAVVFSRTGGGGERPLVDRGVHAEAHGANTAPGEGPALSYAKAGFAGVTVDGPHGGLRNITMGDEQFLMFNVQNPTALRDNVRQSAAELALVTHVLDGVTIDASSCPDVVVSGGGPVLIDTGTLALMGHSMGATIAPPTAAVEPRFRAVILSGAGGSYIENVLHKESPLSVKGLAEIILGYRGLGYPIRDSDPVLTLLQWAAEPSDSPVYGRRIFLEPRGGAPRHVLMLQGIVDTYILPPIANATSLSFGLDLAGDEHDRGDDPRLAEFTPLGDLLSYTGRSVVDLPAQANATSSDGDVVTAVVVQHVEDGIEDGHEVVFQTEGPKHQYRCFLEGLAAGAPWVPTAGALDDPCVAP